MINTETTNLERPKSTEKAKAIIEGAMQEFLAHGYAATSMDRVAKAAGVSKATVYSHFGDKEGLFNTLIKGLAEDKFKTVIELQESPSLEYDPQLFLQRLANQLLENGRSDRTFQDFIRIIIGESGRFPELAKAYVNNLAKPAIEILTKYFKSHPELNLPDEEAAVRVFMGTLIYYMMLQELLHGKDIVPLESNRLINTLTHLITVAKD